MCYKISIKRKNCFCQTGLNHDLNHLWQKVSNAAAFYIKLILSVWQLHGGLLILSGMVQSLQCTTVVTNDLPMHVVWNATAVAGGPQGYGTGTVQHYWLVITNNSWYALGAYTYIIYIYIYICEREKEMVQRVKNVLYLHIVTTFAAHLLTLLGYSMTQGLVILVVFFIVAYKI